MRERLFFPVEVGPGKGEGGWVERVDERVG